MRRRTPAEDLIESPAHEQYQVARVLGRGSSGLVSQVRRISDGAVFAMKDINLHADSGDPAEEANKAQREIGILARLSKLSPNIVAMVEAWTSNDGESLKIVMEFVDGGSLRDVLDEYKNKDVRLSKKTAREWLMQLGMGMAVIHSLNIIHRDIKPDNLLLTRDRTLLKIADLGLAKDESVRFGGSQVSLVGAIAYCSPEELQGNPALDYLPVSQSDMYSLGCVLYEMLSGFKAFRGPIATVARSIVEGTYDRPPPDGLHDLKMLGICHRLMNLKQGDRPSTIELLASPCLKSYVRKYFLRFPALGLRFSGDIAAEETLCSEMIGSTSTAAYSLYDSDGQASDSCSRLPAADLRRSVDHRFYDAEALRTSVLADEWFSAYGSRIVVNGPGPVCIPELPNQDLHLKRDSQTGSWILDGKDSLGRPVTWHLDEEESHESKACWKRGDGFLRSVAASTSLL
ncbi:Serine/threonine-protein kinase Nek8, partial [Perkinsus olseni]